MESSSLVSWQFENFSTAELSPPVSPVSPSSPQFYDGSNPSSPSSTGFKGLNASTTASPMLFQSQKPLLSSRAQAASNMLNELERLHSFEDQNAFELGFKEESVDLNNMNLFEELADIEYTPPLFSSEDAMEVPCSPSAAVASPVPMMPSVVPSLSSSKVNNAKLSDEFKTIVESLNITPSKANMIVSSPTPARNAVTSLGDLFQIAGIPTTTVVGEECLIPVEFIGRPTPGGGLGAEEAESMDLDGIIISNDMALINESELFGLGEELSAELIANDSDSSSSADVKSIKSTLVNGVMPYWAKDITIPMDELDTQMNKNADTLDALLKGDVSTAAKNVLTSPRSSSSSSAVAGVLLPQVYSPVSIVSDDEISTLESADVVEVIPPPKPAPAPQKKTERRGRKPGKMYKDPLTYVKEKALRKKEQNKTAATRYRQKKKQELAITLEEEEKLQKVHDDLEKEKEKVGAEVKMIRSLLRDMLQVRKQRVAPSPPVTAGRLTASSIVQGRKIVLGRK